MMCPHCGRTLSPDAKYCPACGHAQRAADSQLRLPPGQQTADGPLQALRQQIGDSLAKARVQQRIIRRRNIMYNMATICLSGVGTLTAGLATILNQPLLNDWRLTCGIAAVFGLATTIVAGLQQNLASSDLLTEVNACVARLRALEIETTTLNYNPTTVKQQYQNIVAESARVEL